MDRTTRFMVSGALAGGISAAIFALVHDIFISDIWFSLPALIIAGAICGFCLSWTYGLLFEKPSTRSWMAFNGLFIAMFGLLGLVSLLTFKPVTTIQQLIIANAPPSDLIRQALPVTVIFTLIMAAVISRLYAKRWPQAVGILVTCSVLVLILGMNVSVIGLVSIPRSSIYLVGELFGLILALGLVYMLVFIGLARLRRTPRNDLY